MKKDNALTVPLARSDFSRVMKRIEKYEIYNDDFSVYQIGGGFCVLRDEYATITQSQFQKIEQKVKDLSDSYSTSPIVLNVYYDSSERHVQRHSTLPFGCVTRATLTLGGRRNYKYVRGETDIELTRQICKIYTKMRLKSIYDEADFMKRMSQKVKATTR